MWLINVDTFKLHNFVGQTPGYAALSHTWGDEEVTFQEIHDLDAAKMRAGFWKISQTCQQAKRDGLEFAWVDTCCIDKTSSAELQEAINSMFEWYVAATQCYAYLVDVDKSDDFSRSRWFSRGWTLQELLGPMDMKFYGTLWNFLGTRNEHGDAISEITGIPQSMLSARRIVVREPFRYDPERDKFRILEHYSVAQRMSWASTRQCSRVEDEAYSLLGLFGVFMPLLYGERRRAFVRLQEEIISINPDLSIFAWEGRFALMGQEATGQCLFAESAHYFNTCEPLCLDGTEQKSEDVAEISVSAVGIKAKLKVMPFYINDHEHADFVIPLNCYHRNDPTRVVALKVVSQKSNNILGSILEDPDGVPRSLSMLPYSIASVGKAMKRTAHVDVLEAHHKCMVKSIILLRQQQRPATEWEPRLARGLISRISMPMYAWVRFSSKKQKVPSWSFTHAYPPVDWNLEQLILSLTGCNGNVIRRPASSDRGLPVPYIVGAIAFKRHDIVNSHVVISIACPCAPENTSFWEQYDRALKVFFRVDIIPSGESIREPGDLSRYCSLLMRINIPMEDAAEIGKQGSMSAKGVQLYDGTKVYDGSAFVVKPELRMLTGRWVMIMHVFDLLSVEHMGDLDQASPVPVFERGRLSE